MIKRSTWVMVVVLALLAGLAYYMRAVPDNFIVQALTAGRTPTPTPFVESLLIPREEGPANAITVTGADGHRFTLKHEGSGWMLSVDDKSPVMADQGQAERAADASLGIQLKSVNVPVNLSDLTGFGLEKPTYTYEVTLANGNTLRFMIGATTVTGDGYYVQKEDNTVVVVNKYAIDPVLDMLKQPPYPPTATPLPGLATGTPTPSN